MSNNHDIFDDVPGDVLDDKATPLTVKCPNCSKPVAWSEASIFRPFCSARCKDSDFIDWASEKNCIAGSNDYNDAMSDTLDS